MAKEKAGFYFAVSEKEIKILRNYATWLSRKTGCVCTWRRAFELLISKAKVEMESDPIPKIIQGKII